MKTLLIVCILLGTVSNLAFAKDRPKLVVVLVFDQFRADTLSRFESRFLPAKQKDGRLGGFRYLMEKGAYYPHAQHGVLQNMTCPGHAAILTGAYPYQNGIALNDWWDIENGRHAYCVEDESPRYLVGSTVGDELKNSGYKSKVVTVALKDRAAILLGGHRADMAIWMADDFGKNTDGMKWVTSSYYLKSGKLPKWVDDLNKKLSDEKDKVLSWNPIGNGSGRSSLGATPAIPKPIEDLGPAFPHEVKAGTEASLVMPYGVEKTEEAAERAIAANELGRGKDTDLLGVSFSTHDFIGHIFGPNSRELEELTVTEDQYVSRLLNFIDKNVGLKRAVVVMTGDHGASPSPEWLEKAGYKPAVRVDEKNWRADINEFLNQKFKRPHDGDWISMSYELNFYINRKALADKKLELDVVAKEVAKFLEETKKDLVAYAFTAADVRSHTLPPGLHETEILRTYVKGRNGDVMAIPKPYLTVGNNSATHFTGYAYDRTVPILLAGDSVKPGVYSQAAQVIDIAPTLTFLTGTTPPSGSEGRVLSEALR